MNILNFPIIIADGLDLNFYTSVCNATEAIETIDVLNNVYKAYDGLGSKIELRVKNNKVIFEVKNQESLKCELEKLITLFLDAIDVGYEKENSDLLVLLKKSEKFYQ